MSVSTWSCRAFTPEEEKPNIVAIFFQTFAFLATFSSSLLIVLRMHVLNNTSTLR
jgi:hypothetical protein